MQEDSLFSDGVEIQVVHIGCSHCRVDLSRALSLSLHAVSPSFLSLLQYLGGSPAGMLHTFVFMLSFILLLFLFTCTTMWS